MLIKFQPKDEHIKCVPLIPVTPEQKKFRLTRSQVQLLPGVNEVTDQEWDVMKTHLAKEIARKEISIIEKALPKNAKNPADNVHNLKDMPVKEAVALVLDCVSPETFTKWHREETRQEVRLAIVERMKELKIEIPKYNPDGSLDDSDDTETVEDKNELDKMTVEELRAYAAEKKIEVSGNKAEIIAAIKAAEAK